MKHLAVLSILLAITFTMVRNKISHTPYGYDEADYMSAASLGLARNWLDIGSMPLTEFVTLGVRHGADTSQQAALSKTARSTSDPVVYRHWHGPLYYLWLTVPSTLNLDEHATRDMSAIFPLLTALVMYFGSLWVLGGAEGQVAAILSSTLFLWSPVTLETTEIAPHMMFVLWYVCGLIMLAKAATGGGRRFYYAAVICAGLAFSTMEVAFVLVLVLIIFAWRQRAMLDSGRVLLRNSLGFLVATILLAWPSGLFKLSFVKAYLVMLYLAVFRKGAWGNATLAQTWAHRLAISPAEWCLFALALALLATTGKRTAAWRGREGAIAFLSFAVLMILATLRVYAPGPRYMTPFSAALELFTAWTLAPALARLSRPWLVYGTLSALCCLLIWNAGNQMSGFMLREDPGMALTLRALRNAGLAQKTLLAPRVDIPVLHYYFPEMQVQGYTDLGEIPPGDSPFDAILYPDHTLRNGAGGIQP